MRINLTDTESLLMIFHNGYLQVELRNINLGVVCGMHWGQAEIRFKKEGA